jgi:hypothetical protein
MRFLKRSFILADISRLECHSGLWHSVFGWEIPQLERIVKETVEILWEELHPLHMPLPTTESLKSNAKEFENVWNFPHVVGCLDGKHIRVVCPTDSGAICSSTTKSTFLLFFKG